MELVATTAPGLDDLLVLGRIKAFENERPTDVIIVDGPAAGHALDLVRAPVQLKRAIGSGPISQQADEVLTMLSDSARCKVMLVTTAAITPVTETCEAADELMDKAHTLHLPPSLSINAILLSPVLTKQFFFHQLARRITTCHFALKLNQKQSVCSPILSNNHSYI